MLKLVKRVGAVLLVFSITSCGNGETKNENVADSTTNSAAQTLQTTGAQQPEQCTSVSEADISALFDKWNASLETGDPEKVVENYAADSVLLPTVSDQVRLTPEEKKDYFEHWLPNSPKGVVNDRWIEIDCDHAVDAGTYTFTYADGTSVAARYTFVYGLENGQWKILTHHSSAMPEPGAGTQLPAATASTGSPEAETEVEQCPATSDEQIAGLFNRWNDALVSGDPAKVVDNYDDNSILLPTVSNKVRFTEGEKEDYFVHFLEKKPVGSIDQRWTSVDCTTATDSGLYTFTFADGSSTKARFTFTYRWDGEEWKITSHHSSAMPEGGAGVDTH